MKRNMEVIREIMLQTEAEREGNVQVKGFDEEMVRYNMALLIQANLAEGAVEDGVSNTSQAPSDVVLNNLTWEGHEFLDNLRQENVWNTLKDEFKDASMSTLISVSKKLAEGYAKKKLEELL